MKEEMVSIALIEDDLIVGESLKARLDLEGYDCQWFEKPDDALNSVKHHDFSLIICDIRMPGLSGEQFFDSLIEQGCSTSILFITGYGTIEQAVRLLHKGASDYLTKPVNISILLDRINELTSQENLQNSRPNLIVPGLRSLFKKIPNLSNFEDTVVLIQGESGVGKEVLARHIHETLCPQQPFEPINCAAIPDELAASELFGHEKGAFTGAYQTHEGAFERAETGVLFLDEIGDMPLNIQVHLLRAIQERTYQRIGGRNSMPFRARLICATHQDLKELVRTGKFREDLYYRLNVVQFDIPPLRERPADILWLAQQFIEKNAKRVHRTTPPIIPKNTQDALLSYDWPGNVRELKNIIDRACIFCDDNQLLPEILGIPTSQATRSNLKSIRHDAERDKIIRALLANEGHMQNTARSLDISRKTLWEKMKKLSIDKHQLNL